MVIRTILGWLSQKGSREILREKQEERAAAERRKKEGAPVWKSEELERERPEYSPEEQAKIRAIFRKRFDQKPDFIAVDRQVGEFFRTATEDQIKSFALFALMRGRNYPVKKAESLAQIAAKYRDHFHGGFIDAYVLRSIERDAREAAEKDPSIVNSDEYNFVKLVLAKPQLYSKWIFSVFQQRPPGGVAFPSD
jgi:hypothetical protein